MHATTIGALSCCGATSQPAVPKELQQTAKMVSFVLDVAAELTKITQFAESNFNKLPATEGADNSAHYCFGFEEGKDIMASARRGTRQ